MRKLFLTLVFTFLSCGMEPLMKPLGCYKGDWQCICNAGGYCYWIFVCED